MSAHERQKFLGVSGKSNKISNCKKAGEFSNVEPREWIFVQSFLGDIYK